ncbi:uncharacterized protein LOC144652200 [Oculina patagonica]
MLTWSQWKSYQKPNSSTKITSQDSNQRVEPDKELMAWGNALKTITPGRKTCNTEPELTSGGRVKIFGKSAVDVPRLIEAAIGENLQKYRNCGSELFVCNSKCYRRLQRFEKAEKNLKSIKEEISVFFGNPVAWSSPQYSGDDLLRHAFSAPLLTSTPVSKSNQSKATETATETAVKLSIVYPSKPVNKTLTREYEALGKGLPSRIATAVMKCAPLTNLVIAKVLRLLKTEVGDLCSKKNPSLLRNCTQEALTNFDFEGLCNEWKKRAPIFYSFLLTACTTGPSQNTTTWLPSMAVAGSILLKQRNPHMNATASIMSLVLKTKSVEVSIALSHVC